MDDIFQKIWKEEFGEEIKVAKIKKCYKIKIQGE